MTSELAPIDRRQLLKTAVALVAGAMVPVTVATPLHAAEDKSMGHAATHGIAEMHLQTTRLDALHRFYEQDLSLPANKQGGELTVDAGQTRIVFESVSGKNGDPFYHFAFNIPENKLESARQWQKQRTPLIRRGNNEVIHFSRWNAHSVFFNDPAGNILEYIARHDLNNAAEGEFSTSDILYASEIGLVVDDVAETVAVVKQKLGMDIYRDNFEFFASLGDEHALLILVQHNRKWTPDKVRPAKVFPTVAAIRGLQSGLFVMEDHRYRITTEPVLSDEQRKYLQAAIAEARNSAEAGGVPLGAVIVKDGRIIGRGHNRRLQDGDPIMHSEIVALRGALQQGGLKACQGATLYCTGMSCDMCAAANAYWGIKEVVAARLDGFDDTRPFYESKGVRVIEVDMDEPKQLLKRYWETRR